VVYWPVGCFQVAEQETLVQVHVLNAIKKLLKKKHETTIDNDIKNLFGQIPCKSRSHVRKKNLFEM